MFVNILFVHSLVCKLLKFGELLKVGHYFVLEVPLYETFLLIVCAKKFLYEICGRFMCKVNPILCIFLLKLIQFVFIIHRQRTC